MKNLFLLLLLVRLSIPGLHAQDQQGQPRHTFVLCSGDTSKIGLPYDSTAIRLWPELPIIIPNSQQFDYTGDSVLVSAVNTSDTAFIIENFLVNYFFDNQEPPNISVSVDTLVIVVLPQLVANLPEMYYSACAGDTIPIYYPYVPYGYMYVDPSESSRLDTNSGSPRLDLFPDTTTVYDLFIANSAGCQIGPFPLTVNLSSSFDSLSFPLYDSICYNSDPFFIPFYPSDAFISGPGVGSDGQFYPELAGEGLHTLTLTKGIGTCVITLEKQIYIVNEAEVSFADIPNICQNASKIELNTGQPAGGVYLGEGVEFGFLNPSLLSPGNYEISYSFVGADECRIQKTQTYFVKAIPAKPDLIIDGDSSTCAGDTLVLGASIFAPRYIWSTGDTTQYITAFNQGFYYVSIAAANGCRNYSDTTFFGFYAAPITELVSPLQTNGYNVTAPGSADGSIDLVLEGGFPPFLFSWSNGATTEDLEGLNSGPYVVTIIDSGGCITRDSIFLSDPVNTSIGSILAEGEFNGLKIPNAFTPNGDGFNDTWRFGGLSSALERNEVLIFDKRGQLVYRMQNYRAQWDGRDLNGNILPEDDYFWVFRTPNAAGVITGNVNLQR